MDVHLTAHAKQGDRLQDVRSLTAALPESLAVKAKAGTLRKLLRSAAIDNDHLLRLAAGAPEMA